MLAIFFNQIGTRYAAMRTLGSILGSEVLHLKTFQQKQTRVSKAMCESTDDILSQSVELIRRIHFDGSWHTHSHNSKYGFVSVIEITTGHVVDYEILCRSARTVLHIKINMVYIVSNIKSGTKLMYNHARSIISEVLMLWKWREQSKYGVILSRRTICNMLECWEMVTLRHTKMYLNCTLIV